ncbi:LemA family protein [Microvirga tunisiensis]|uniref:LemA family protein n=1 Tax=Microvirga tunisiensis TaxID=2108360 RepID=A0A5N7MRI4_9HYPH|nr:LemA family protein [Microvirga tunisiensis]MPR29612.1 LemA family protein [Microvirga tunisiensis]
MEPRPQPHSWRDGLCAWGCAQPERTGPAGLERGAPRISTTGRSGAPISRGSAEEGPDRTRGARRGHGRPRRGRGHPQRRRLPGRAGALPALRAGPQRLSDALERLYTTIKRYPELTGDTALQNRLHEFQRQEDQLVVARSDLIGAVRAHNEELGRFPGGWIAAIIDAKAKPLTTFAQAEIEQPPTPAKP